MGSDTHHTTDIETLDAGIRAQMLRTTGQTLPPVRVYPDQTLQSRGLLGEARDGAIHLAPDVPGPDSSVGRAVRLHEAAHLAQMQGPSGAAGAHGSEAEAVEHDAHAIAQAAERGAIRPVGVRADPRGAYGLPEWLSSAVESIDIHPMSWLRQSYPEVAALIDGGLEPLLQQLGALAGSALDSLFESLGASTLIDAFSSVIEAIDPDSLGFGILTGCCACLDTALDSLLASLQGLLDSEGGRALQSRIAQSQQADRAGLLDSLTDFVSLLHKVGGPIVEIMESVSNAVAAARARLGSIGATIWEFIANKLGLRADLPPLQAIQLKLRELWPQSDVLSTLTARIKEVANILVEVTPLRLLTRLIQDVPRLLDTIEKLMEVKERSTDAWLAVAAEELSGTVFEPLILTLQSGDSAFREVAGMLSAHLLGLADTLGQLAGWQAPAAFLQGIAEAVSSFVNATRDAIANIATGIRDALAEAGEALKNLYEALKPLLDFALGLVTALLLSAVGQLWALPMFVLGNLFIHVLPDCYKEPILDFILKAFIAMIEWYPAEGMPIVTVVRAGALGFLRGLLAASQDAKVKGMNLIASLFAGNVEFAAGLGEGIVRGVYESTIGTVVFVFEAAAWLASLSSEIMSFASIPMENHLMRMAEGGAAGAPRPAAPGPDEDLDATSIEQDDDTEVEAGVELAPDEEDDATPDEDEEPPSFNDEEGPYESEAELAPDEEEAPAWLEEEEDRHEGVDQVWSPGASELGLDSEAEATEDDAGSVDRDADRIEPPPSIPAMASGRALFDAIFKSEISRAELEELLIRLDTSLEAAAAESGEQAAAALIQALTSDSAAYEMGKVVGTIVGMVVTEVAIIVLTAGAGAAKTGVTLTKLSLKAARQLPTLIKALRTVRAALRPLLSGLQKLKGALSTWVKAVARYIDDLIVWARRTLRMLASRARRAPRTRKPGRPRARPGKPKKVKKPIGKDQVALRTAAMRGARTGWRTLERTLGQAVHRKSAVRGKLKTVRVSRARGITVSLSLAERGSGWQVMARARRRLRSMTWKSGQGWITRAHEKRTKYYATQSHLRLHKTIIHDAITALLKQDDRDFDQLKDAYDYKKKEQLPKLEKEGQSRLKLRGVKFRIHAEGLRGVEADGEMLTELVVTPNASREKRNVPLKAQSLKDLKKARNTFKGRLWVKKELVDLLRKNESTVASRIQSWKGLRTEEEGKLYTWQTRPGDPKTEYTFSKERAGERPKQPTSERARAKYGYTNPKHSSSIGIKILLKGHHAGSPAPPAKNARYFSTVPGSRYMDFTGDSAVLGHHRDMPAVKHWNTEGHKKERTKNEAWNHDPGNYAGPEHKEESRKEGLRMISAGIRYLVPRKSIGSHPSWWKDDASQ